VDFRFAAENSSNAKQLERFPDSDRAGNRPSGANPTRALSRTRFKFRDFPRQVFQDTLALGHIRAESHLGDRLGQRRDYLVHIDGIGLPLTRAILGVKFIDQVPIRQCRHGRSSLESGLIRHGRPFNRNEPQPARLLHCLRKEAARATFRKAKSGCADASKPVRLHRFICGRDCAELRAPAAECAPVRRPTSTSASRRATHYFGCLRASASPPVYPRVSKRSQGEALCLVAPSCLSAHALLSCRGLLLSHSLQFANIPLVHSRRFDFLAMIPPFLILGP